MLAARNLLGPIATGDDLPTRGPTSPLERRPQSPKRWKKKESDGIGLAIVAKLGKARSRDDEPTVEIAIKNFRAGGPGWAGRTGNYTNPSPTLEDFHVADFLACCYLCKKRLHGKDIYMYRGEKAFCSIECRYQQIVSDDCLDI